MYSNNYKRKCGSMETKKDIGKADKCDIDCIAI